MSTIHHKQDILGGVAGMTAVALFLFVMLPENARAQIDPRAPRPPAVEAVQSSKPEGAPGSIVKLMYGVSYRGTNCIIVETKSAVSIGCGAVAP
jgi:hypothetical protein